MACEWDPPLFPALALQFVASCLTVYVGDAWHDEIVVCTMPQPDCFLICIAWIGHTADSDLLQISPLGKRRVRG
jgi:hypothetical protein